MARPFKCSKSEADQRTLLERIPDETDKQLIDILTADDAWGKAVRRTALSTLLNRAIQRGYDVGRASHTQSDGMS